MYIDCFKLYIFSFFHDIHFQPNNFMYFCLFSILDILFFKEKVCQLRSIKPQALHQRSTVNDCNFSLELYSSNFKCMPTYIVYI